MTALSRNDSGSAGPEVQAMATPSTREGAAAMVDESNGQGEQGSLAKPSGWVESVRRFFHEVSLEMKKVSWPTQQEVINTTLIVIVAVFFFSFFLFGADVVLSYLIKGIEWGAKKILG